MGRVQERTHVGKDCITVLKVVLNCSNTSIIGFLDPFKKKTLAVQENISLLFSDRENYNSSILLSEIFILKQDFFAGRQYSQHCKARK